MQLARQPAPLHAGLVIRPHRAALFLVAVTLALAAINGACLLLVDFETLRRHASFRLFDLGREGNIPSFFSAAVLVAAGLSAAVNAAARQPAGAAERTWTPRWRALALVFVFLAIDEAAQIHEEFSRLKLGLTGDLAFIDHYSWVLVYGPAAALTGLAFLPFLLALPRQTALLMVLSGLVYILGAVGLEVVGAFQQITLGLAKTDAAVALRAVAEETVETLGIVMFIWVTLDHAARAGVELGLRIGRRGAA